MTEQEYKQAKQVLANAPRGATHIDDDGCYVKQIDYENGFADSKTYFNWGEGWKFAKNPAFCLTQSLSDLRTMVEQYEENERLEELEKGLHNFLFDNANALKDGHFYTLRGLLRKQENYV